jgi:hypothetical protein
MRKHFVASIVIVACAFLSACTVMQVMGMAPTNTPVPTDRPTVAPTARRTATAVPTPKTYREITWLELTTFLSNDHTNWNAYDEDTYTCVNFAMDLQANAEKENLHVWLVGVVFDPDEAGHAFVAFETSDKGVVWIEPQDDYAYASVVVGKPLCMVVDTSACWEDGNVTEIMQPLECDAYTSECWLKTN